MSTIIMERNHLSKALTIALSKLGYQPTHINDLIDDIKVGDSFDIHAPCRNAHNSPKSINGQCLECSLGSRFEPKPANSQGHLKRRDAIALNLKQYNTGNPCKHGHYSPRYTQNAACIECSTNKKPDK